MTAFEVGVWQAAYAVAFLKYRDSGLVSPAAKIANQAVESFRAGVASDESHMLPVVEGNLPPPSGDSQ